MNKRVVLYKKASIANSYLFTYRINKIINCYNSFVLVCIIQEFENLGLATLSPILLYVPSKCCIHTLAIFDAPEILIIIATALVASKLAMLYIEFQHRLGLF